MLLIYMAEDAITTEERDQCYIESAALARELHERGQYVSASPLQPVSVATSVRVREGRRMVIDGPFAETKEQLGGYFMVDVKDLDEAIAIASRIPGAKAGTVEIRPVMELPGLLPGS
ncbi:MAG: YciI family protein [Bryobacterales bacterium]|nr:YciI family protein [Bryobacterales bacterium]